MGQPRYRSTRLGQAWEQHCMETTNGLLCEYKVMGALRALSGAARESIVNYLYGKYIQYKIMFPRFGQKSISAYMSPKTVGKDASFILQES